MDILDYDDHNILFNGQPYPKGSMRLIYPTLDGDNTVSMLFPWWQPYNLLWRGDAAQVINGRKGTPFGNLESFKEFCNHNIY